jgi:hypothetical protein
MALQASNAAGFISPPTFLNEPKHSMLSSRKRCQAAQSILSLELSTGRCFEGSGATGAAVTRAPGAL